MIRRNEMEVNEAVPDTKPKGIVHVAVKGELVLQDSVYREKRAGEVVLKKTK